MTALVDVNGDWEAKLAYKLDAKGNRKGLEPTVANAITILANDARWIGKIAFNEFAQEIELESPPWHVDDSYLSAGVKHSLTDTDVVRVQAWFSRFYEGFHLGRETVRDAIATVAERRRVHPVRDWLRGLEWDAEPRVATWLATYVGAEASPYLESVGRCFLVGAVARIMDPGCKLDTMPVFEGAQGAGKSTMLRTLFGREWFADTPLDLASKDRFVGLRAAWCVEFAELDSLGRADIDRIKSFLSSPVDSYRPPFGRSVLTVPRQCVFAGTTNGDEYLRDVTGNRRFFPLKCGAIDLRGLTQAREQLWAEAVQLYEAKVKWHLEDSELGAAREEQQARVHRDAWCDVIETWLVGHPFNQLTVGQLLEDCFKLDKGKWTPGDQARIGRALAQLGWERKQTRDGARRHWLYRRREA